jgi:hypothetical protein
MVQAKTGQIVSASRSGCGSARVTCRGAWANDLTMMKGGFWPRLSGRDEQSSRSGAAAECDGCRGDQRGRDEY